MEPEKGETRGEDEDEHKALEMNVDERGTKGDVIGLGGAGERFVV
jgi:hypothetical protein